MSYAIHAQKKTTPAAKKRPAGKATTARKRASGNPAIDTLLDRVRLRGEALSADIKDLLARIG